MSPPLNATYSPPKCSASLPASHPLAHLGPQSLRRLGASTEEDESVGKSSSSLIRLLAVAAEPDRNRSCGLGQQRRSVDPVEATREVHDRFGEETAKQIDLLFLSSPPSVEVLPECLVLHRVPADAHPKRRRPFENRSTSAAWRATSAV